MLFGCSTGPSRGFLLQILLWAFVGGERCFEVLGFRICGFLSVKAWRKVSADASPEHATPGDPQDFETARSNMCSWWLQVCGKVGGFRESSRCRVQSLG